jgi:tetratricopeptide (TPR) repeat protein
MHVGATAAASGGRELQDEGKTAAMSESTSTQDDPVSDGAPAGPDAAPRDRRLTRILVGLAVAVGVLVVVFGVVYYLGQHTDSGPSMSERAVSSAEEAVKQKPNDVGLRLALASAYQAQKMNEEAVAQYQEVLRVQPDNRTALLGSALIHYEGDDLATAATEFQHVVDVSGGAEFSSVDPQLERALYFLGAIQTTQKDYATAVKSLESALKIDATDADAWYTLGNAQSGAQNYEKAAAAYLEGLRFVPVGWCEPYDGLKAAYEKLSRSDGVTFAQAMAAICRGDAEAGMADLKTVDSGEFQIPALLGLGQAARATGDAQGAITWYRKVRDLDPTNVAALSALAELGDTSMIQKPSSSPDTTASTS